MPRSKTNRKARRGQGQEIVKIAGTVPSPAESAPPRGVKLKTVSRFTMLFAATCLLAFMAGRPPGAVPGSALVGQRDNAVAGTPSDALDLGRKNSRAKPLPSDAIEIQPYIDRSFYIGLRVGSYELGLAKRSEN